MAAMAPASARPKLRVRPGHGVFLLAALLLGCDTTAEISFVKERLSSTFTVVGYRPDDCAKGANPLATCEPPGCGELDFVMETTVGRFLVPNLQIVGLDGRLVPGENFGASDEDIQFQRTWLFQQDDQGLDKQCQTASECHPGFECKTFTTDDLPSDSSNVGLDYGLCARRARVEEKVGALHFRALNQDTQPENPNTSGLGYRGLSLILDLDNSGSLLGVDDVGHIDRNVATDPTNDRIAAVITFLNELNAVDRSAFERDGTAEYGVLELAGSGNNGVVNTFAIDQAIRGSFVSDLDTVIDAVQRLQGRSEGATPVWESYVAAANAFSNADDNATPNYARRVLAVVDSGADGSADGRTVDNAIEALSLASVNGSTTIVHLDSMAPSDKTRRTGPVADYTRLACETGGYYLYEVWPRSLQDHLRRLGVAYEGIWSVPIEVLAEGGGSVTPLSELPAGWYRLSGTMEVAVANETSTFQFQTRKGTFSDATSDSRLLFHVE